MCTEFNLKIDESTELLDTRTFDNYDTNELLQLSDAIKQSCFEFLFSCYGSEYEYNNQIHLVTTGIQIRPYNKERNFVQISI